MEKKMGFDLYGVKPKIKEGSVKPKRPDWNNCSDAEKDEYFDALSKFENENKGYYFRNNVWHWRPLAQYVIEHTQVITDQKKIEGFSYNDGVEISEQEAVQIARQLKHLIKTGHTEKYAEEYMAVYTKAKKNNIKVQKELEIFQDAMDKKHGKDIAPKDYPKDDYEKWNVIYSKFDNNGSYPFSIGNVKEFAEFAEQSGGFQIC
jgi:hypothetical protein